MGKKIFFALGILMFVTAAALILGCPQEIKNVIGSAGKITIVVDPGHGGIDGGAESSAGVCEKDINLAISMKIKEKEEEEG